MFKLLSDVVPGDVLEVLLAEHAGVRNMRGVQTSLLTDRMYICIGVKSLHNAPHPQFSTVEVILVDVQYRQFFTVTISEKHSTICRCFIPAGVKKVSSL